MAGTASSLRTSRLCIPGSGLCQGRIFIKMKEKKLKRISIYFDGANFYYGLKTIDKRYSDIYFDFERFVKEIVGEDQLITIYY